MGAKKLSAGAQIINLFPKLTEAERVLIYDVFRSAQPKKKGEKKSSKKAAAPTATNGQDDAENVINS